MEKTTKKLVIVWAKGQTGKVMPLIKKGANGSPVIISLNIDASLELGKMGLEFKELGDYGISDIDIREESTEWFKAWANTRIKDGKNIKELLVYNNISLWWLVNTWLYSSTFFYDSIASVLKYVTILEQILKIENPDEVYCPNDSKLPYRVIRQVCQAKNILLTTISHPAPGRQLLANISMSLFIYGKWLRNILRKSYWQILSFGRRSQNHSQDRGKILIFTGESWTRVYDLATSKPIKGDLYFDSVEQILTGKGYEVTQLGYPTLPFRPQLASLKEGSRQKRVDYKPFEHYLSGSVILRALKNWRGLCRQRDFLSSPEFRDSLTFHGVPLYDLVRDKFSFAFSRFMLEIITMIEIAQRIIQKENPGVVIVAGETSYDRAVIATARSNGIPVLGYQHGVVHLANMYYNLEPGDVGPDGEVTVPYCPIVNKAAVDGQYVKEIMVKMASYAEENVVVIGQPRYDILARPDKVFDRERVFQKFNLDNARKLIVWTTDPHEGNEEEYEREAHAVYGVLKQLGGDVELITKLHPGELGAPLHHKVARLVGVRPIVTEYSIYELLHACDIMITKTSTTAIEAAILDKPIIVLNLSGEKETVPYVAEGIALGVYNKDGLVPAVNSILHSKDVRLKLEDARQSFVYKHAYLQDGQASQRFADLIINMLPESSRKSIKKQVVI